VVGGFEEEVLDGFEEEDSWKILNFDSLLDEAHFAALGLGRIGTEVQGRLGVGRRRWQVGGWGGLAQGGSTWGWRRRGVGRWRRDLAAGGERGEGLWVGWEGWVCGECF